GVVSETDREVIHTIALECNLGPQATVVIDHDIRIALAGGLAGKEGIALIVGTGSSCYGRRDDGQNHRTGWGYMLDDLGSGYFLGLQAMVAAIHEADGRGATTRLSKRVQESLHYRTVDDIMRILYHDHLSVAEIAALAPVVLESAEGGDAVALNIVNRAGEELARMVEAVATTLRFQSHLLRITMVGGLTQSVFYKKLIQTAIRRRIKDCTIQDPELPPVIGAVLLAMESARIARTPSLLATLKGEAAQQALL